MDKVNSVPGFILKLWKMINDPQCDDLISWSDNGQSFIIADPSRFAQELSKYFKHNNLSSFIRQLNMYGFRKVATIENSGLHPGTDDLHFYHTDFIRNYPERLEAIKRKLPQKLAETVDLRNVYKGISEIEVKQKDVSKTLADIKRENEMLWAELHDLRHKHQQQQLYISRLMKLVFEAMEQNGIKTNLLQVRRNPPLMIEGGQISATGDVPGTTTNVISANTPTITFVGDAATELANALYTSPTTISQQIQILSNVNEQSNYETQDLDTHKNMDIESNYLDSVNSLGTPVVDPTSFQMASPNNDLPDVEAQIENAEYQIDTLVPTIGDFSEEDMNFLE